MELAMSQSARNRQHVDQASVFRKAFVATLAGLEAIAVAQSEPFSSRSNWPSVTSGPRSKLHLGGEFGRPCLGTPPSCRVRPPESRAAHLGTVPVAPNGDRSSRSPALLDWAPRGGRLTSPRPGSPLAIEAPRRTPQSECELDYCNIG